MPLAPRSISIDPLSFFLGFVIASVFWWMVTRARPLWNEMVTNVRARREDTKARRASNIEENHRRVTLRRAQGMHLAAPLFALDEVIVEPLLMAPPAHVEPGNQAGTEDAVSLTLPYLPAWPEMAAVYDAPTLSVEEALAGGMNLVLIGQPGIGKTVALAHIATLASNRSESLGTLKDSVPFLLHVADLKLPVTAANDLLDRITEMTAEHASVLDSGRVPSFVQNTFRSGRALLLLDGFDELIPDIQRQVTDALKMVLAQYPKTRVVTTGAPEYLDGLLALHFAPLSVAAWSKPSHESFMQRWSVVWSRFVALEAWAQTGPSQVDPILLNTWIAADSRFLTPLEVTLKVWAAYAGDALGPQVREAIAAHVRRLAPANTPLAALETLAMQVTLACAPVFDPHQARGWVQAFEVTEEGPAPAEGVEAQAAEAVTAAPEPNSGAPKKDKKRGAATPPAPTSGLLGQLVSTGLLVSHPNNKMRFLHPVFAGFLAGSALSGFKAEDDLLGQADWTGKLLAMHYLASFGDATAIAKKLLDWSRLPMHRPLLTSARWLRDAPRSAPWRSKVMTALAELLQTEGLPLALRGQALAALIMSGDPGVPALFRQLTNTLSFELMRLLALGLGALGDPKAVKILVNVLQAPSVSARRAACLALISIGSPEALEAVAQTLLTGDEDLRRAAAEALANDPREGHAMLKDGVTMSDILLRRAVVYGLARVKEPWALELLQRMRLEDDQWVVRNSAGEVIEAMNAEGNPHIPRPLMPPSQSPWLIAFAGTQGVGISPGAPATQLLIQALKSPKDDERLAALDYLKEKPADGIVKQIYGAMYGDDSDLREAAFNALWEIGSSGYKLPNPTQFGFS
ncbi:MAG TPA: HEAT repeat domain-containing protein [Anaerolineales bacterium]